MGQRVAGSARRRGGRHWTDDRTTYAEIHGGIAPTFWDQAYLPPGGAIEWREAWFPVAGTGGLTTASRHAALHLAVSGGQATVGVQPTASQPGGLVALCRRGEPDPVYSAPVALSPAAPLQATVAVGSEPGLVLSYLDRRYAGYDLETVIRH